MKLSILLVIFIFSTDLLAQSVDNSVINSSGSTLSNSEIILDFSLGELAVNQYDEMEITVSEGFLNGYNSGVINSIENFELFEMTVYPNPSSRVLNISFNQNKKTGVIHLFHFSGIEVLKKQVNTGDQELQLDVSKLEEGVYYLRTLSDDGKSRNAHKILIIK